MYGKEIRNMTTLSAKSDNYDEQVEVNLPASSVISRPYYAYVDRKTDNLVGIGGTKSPTPVAYSIAITEKFANRFLKDRQRISEWTTIRKGERTYIVHKGKKATKIEQPHLLQILPHTDGFYDIETTIYHDRLEVRYNGETMLRNSKTTKLYFTEKNNPFSVLCVLTLSCETLDALSLENTIGTWVNPIIVNLVSDFDISLYVTDASLSINLKYV